MAVPRAAAACPVSGRARGDGSSAGCSPVRPRTMRRRRSPASAGRSSGTLASRSRTTRSKKPGSSARWVRRGSGGGVAVADEDGPGVLLVERRRPGGDLVQDAAQRVEVAAVVDLLTADLLGRHVVRGAHGEAGGGEPGAHADVVAEPRYAEVADLHGAVGQPHDVGGFEVAVDDAPPVGVAEGVRDLFGDVDDVLDGERVLLVLLQELAQVLPVEQLHDEVRDVLVLAEVVDDGDAPVLERGGHPGLAPEAFAQDAGERLIVLRAHGFEAFDGDLTAQRLVERAPHLAHAAPPDQLDQPVAALDPPGLRHLPLPAPVVPRRPAAPAAGTAPSPVPSSMAAGRAGRYAAGWPPGDGVAGGPRTARSQRAVGGRVRRTSGGRVPHGPAVVSSVPCALGPRGSRGRERRWAPCSRTVSARRRVRR